MPDDYCLVPPNMPVACQDALPTPKLPITPSGF
jgi:hypothetical protein